ncbi:MAG: SDR family NAD(P)-dependent oxidoreductase [Thermoproteota archaeon]|nr:SDR family NAD(P)-dependent oxidoreductase [Thermoproteota archaeon]
MDLTKFKHLFSVQGLVAVVTGAASGIGQAISYVFAMNGGKVVASDINREGLETTLKNIKENGGEAIGVLADITNVEDVRKIKNEALNKYGKINAIYIVPGISVRKPIEELSYSEFDRIIEVNLKGHFIVLKELGPILKNNEDGGSIVLISSIRGERADFGAAAYGASKAALNILAKVAALEWGKYKIRVNVIAPGPIDTPLFQKQYIDMKEWYDALIKRTALRRLGKPEEVAGLAVFLAMPVASYITGTVIYVDGGYLGTEGTWVEPFQT